MSKLRKLGFRKPQSRIEWTMWIGIGFILLAIVCFLLFGQKPIEFSAQTLTVLYLVHFLRDIGFGMIASGILVGGIGLIINDKNKAKGYFVIIGGILLFLFLIGRPVISSAMLVGIQTKALKLSELLIEEQTQTLTTRDLLPVDKANFRKTIAQERYFLDGSLTEYTDDHGNTVKYQPTAEDVQKREQFLIMPRTISILRTEMVFWVITFIVVLTGSIKHYSKKPRGN